MSLSTYHAGPSPRPPKVLSGRGTPRGRKPGAQRAHCRRSAPGLRIHHRGFVLPLMAQGSGTYSASPAEPRCVPSPVTAPIREEPERSWTWHEPQSRCEPGCWQAVPSPGSQWLTARMALPLGRPPLTIVFQTGCSRFLKSLRFS